MRWFTSVWSVLQKNNKIFRQLLTSHALNTIDCRLYRSFTEFDSGSDDSLKIFPFHLICLVSPYSLGDVIELCLLIALYRRIHPNIGIKLLKLWRPLVFMAPRLYAHSVWYIRVYNSGHLGIGLLDDGVGSKMVRLYVKFSIKYFPISFKRMCLFYFVECQIDR